MALIVSLQNNPVGRITLESGNPVFRFLEKYRAVSPRRVLGRWFEDRAERLDPAKAHHGVQGGLPYFFAHDLPPAGSPLRRHLARRAGVAEHREFDLLRELGDDLPGAVTVTGDGDDARVDAPVAGDAAASRDQPLRFSLAGIQLKFSLLRTESHLVLPLTGEGGRWIGKLPDVGDDDRFEDVTANEFAMMTWARESGVTVPAFELRPVSDLLGIPESLTFHGTHAFVTKRFDRPDDGSRVHLEDLAQVFNVPADQHGKYGVGNAGANYTTVGNLIARLCGPDDFDEYLRRIVFMVLSANHDAHLKNWSIYYPDGLRPRLTPAYDLVCTLLYADHPARTKQLDTRLALSLSRTGDPYDVTADHIIRIAEKTGQDAARATATVRTAAARIRDVWRAQRLAPPLKSAQVATIDAHLSRAKL